MTPEEAMDMARAVKERAVADPEDDGDLAPSLVIVRAGHCVARVMLRGDSRNFLRAAAMAIPGFGADLAMLVTDAYTGTEKLHRERGTPEHGELARLWQKGRTDLVGECLSVTWCDREARCWATTLPYVESDGKVEWGEALGSDELVVLGGFVPDGLRAIFADIGETDVESCMEFLGIPTALEMEPITSRAHADAATTKFLAGRGCPTIVFAYDEESARVFKESFGPERWNGGKIVIDDN